MFLYDKKDKQIDIYSFEADKMALIDYRKRVIDKQNFNELFYSFETTSNTIKDRFLGAEELDVRILEHQDKTYDASDWWSQLKQEKAPSKSNRIIQEELIRKYINGDFSQSIPTRIFIPDEGVDCYLKSYLVTSKPSSIYSNVEKRSYYRLENIISLPNNLCALHLLENGKFSNILSTWLYYDEPLQFFSAEQVDSVSEEEMKKMFTYGLLNGTYSDTLENVDNTQKILKRLKR